MRCAHRWFPLLIGTLLLSACTGGSASEEVAGGGKADSLGVADLVVNEIAANPDFDVNGDGKIGTGDEYIEIVNAGFGEARIGGVEFEDGFEVRFVFPDDAVLLPGHAALIMADAAAFKAPKGATVFSAGRLGLNNDGDSITLRSQGTLIEKHGYSLPNGEKRVWNLAIDAQRDSLFQLTEGTPGTRQDGTLFGSSILTEAQLKSVLTELHEECPDTFCGGDFSYYFDDGVGSLDCLGNGSCVLGFQAKPAVEDKFPTSVLEGLVGDALIAVDPGGEFVAELLGSSVRDTSENDQNVFVDVQCQLRADYFRSTDVVQDNGRPTDEFRDHFLDCLGNSLSAETLLSALPTFRGLMTEFERANLMLALDSECPDTFCGGDFSYFFTGEMGSINCVNDGVCELSFSVTPFDGAWADDPLAGLDPNDLTQSAANGSFAATITGSRSDAGETLLEVRCDLLANTFVVEDIYNRDDDEATDSFRDRFVDCVSAIEEVSGVLQAAPQK